MKGINRDDVKIEWLVNGSKAGPQARPDQFNPAETRRGDLVQARAITGGRELLSNTVTIKNTPPGLNRVKIMPEVFGPGARLYIEAAGSDIDGDDVTINYEWIVNSEPAGNSRNIDHEIKKGDRISVKITPYDGETYGKPITLNREIGNMPPLIAEDKNYSFDGNTYSYHVKASDPDGDELTYSLKTAPAGMTIDSSGRIKWEVPPDFNGKTPVAVSVLDGKGGEAAMSFNVEISTEKR